MKIICLKFHIKTPFSFWDMRTWDTRTVCLQTFRNNRIRKKLAYFLRNLQTPRANISRILRIKNAKFWGFCFYVNTNILGDFQICISVPLIRVITMWWSHFSKLKPLRVSEEVMKSFLNIKNFKNRRKVMQAFFSIKNFSSHKKVMESFFGIKNCKTVTVSFFNIKNFKSRKKVMQFFFSINNFKIRKKVRQSFFSGHAFLCFHGAHIS